MRRRGRRGGRIWAWLWAACSCFCGFAAGGTWGLELGEVEVFCDDEFEFFSKLGDLTGREFYVAGGLVEAGVLGGC